MLKIGIMSGASIVPRFVEGIKESGVAQAAAIATRRLEKAQQLATELGIPKAYGSYEALLADNEVELIYIPLINHLHFSAAKAAIQAKKHVLLEKPFTLHPEEAQELYSLAQQHDVFLMEAQKAVFLPAIEDVKKTIDSGKIGQVQLVDIRDARPGSEKIPWFWDMEKGGGVLISNASYPLSVSQYFFGTGFDGYNGICVEHGSGQTDEQCMINLKQKDLLISLFLTTKMSFTSTYSIIGEKGTIIIPNYWKTDHYTIQMNDGEVVKKDFPMNSEFVFEIRHVADLLSSGKKQGTVVDPNMTITNVQVVDDLYYKWFGDAWRKGSSDK
ncbi:MULTISPECIES: Gfo/Idh/MocA family protein [unclassified Enterococcus]|uniref:Gfo/Idh/MocA family protein n=1 Tax=unclassified Enterococcus TaxID=2608891 RepID=UPI001A9A9D92|nr:Gfo/Idh/MocA family oxidoreductase [Enterococcus sp. DIV1271a]MBO1300391.1 Gfo/Idh/MocA family oxidoreductase [Enterococcus sp. DIV1271a]